MFATLRFITAQLWAGYGSPAPLTHPEPTTILLFSEKLINFMGISPYGDVK